MFLSIPFLAFRKVIDVNLHLRFPALGTRNHLEEATKVGFFETGDVWFYLNDCCITLTRCAVKEMPCGMWFVSLLIRVDPKFRFVRDRCQQEEHFLGQIRASRSKVGVNLVLKLILGRRSVVSILELLLQLHIMLCKSFVFTLHCLNRTY